MQRYDSYKPSGVKWLGEIPSHWEMKRWRFLMSENTTKNSNCKERLQLQFRYGDIVRKANQSEESDVLDTITKYTIVEPDDIMINGLNLNYDFISQRVAQVQERGVITSAYISLRPTEIANSKYFTYFLKSMDAKKMFHGMGTGIRLTLSYNELKNQFIPCPSPDEQTAIANYLDTITAKIDAAIAQQQKMIDLLNERKQIIINRAVTRGLNPNAKMKDSGVEWIGEVPEGWEVRKLGYCIDILPGYAFPSQDFVENGIKLLRGINVSPEKIRWEESVYWNKTIDDTLKKYMLEVNDLVLGLDRPWIGSGTRVAIVKKEDLPCLLVQRVCRIRPTNMMSINYIYYLLSNNLFYNALAVDTTGVSVPHISTEQIKKVVIPIPKLSEQNAIVEYIEMHIASINKAIQAANNQISLLQERKQIIINEVVTGKVKVI